MDLLFMASVLMVGGFSFYAYDSGYARACVDMHKRWRTLFDAQRVGFVPDVFTFNDVVNQVEVMRQNAERTHRSKRVVGLVLTILVSLGGVILWIEA